MSHDGHGEHGAAAGHSHGGFGHDHAAGGDRRKLAITFVLACAVVVMQVVGAILTGSIALLADTVHTLTDAAGSGVALLVDKVMHRPATNQRTWGLRRLEVLTVCARAAVLFAVGIYVVFEGVQRLLRPPEIPGRELLVFGGLGLLANTVSLLVLTRGSSGSFNMRAAILEVANDAIGSVGVLLAAIIMAVTGWQRADALAGLLIAALIVPRALRLLRETADVLLESTPPGLDLGAVRADLLGINHVLAVHDLHASLVSSGLPTLSAHVVVDDSCFQDGRAGSILDTLQHRAAEHFGIPVQHTTFQIEPPRHIEHENPMHA